MAKQYSHKETIDTLKKDLAEDVSQLYKSDFVKWKGKTPEGIYYSELIAEELLGSLDKFDKIPRITRNSSYKVQSHKVIVINSESERHEDIFAKSLFGLEFKELGKIIDYQIPIRNTSNDKGFKGFDLLSYNKADNSYYLIELKYDKNKETLLRAMLECYTYFKVIDHDKLIFDYSDEISVNDSIKIKPVVLLVGQCNSYNEFRDLDSKDRHHLKELSLALGIKFVAWDFSLIISNT